MDIRPLTRRQLLVHAAAGGALASLGSRAWAEPDWPKQPIKFIVPYAAGGVTDVTMRMINRQVEKQLGQPIVIDNRGGANGAIGMTAIAKSQKNGYTIGATAGSTVLQTPLLNEVAYEGTDLQFISLSAQVPMVLTVNATMVPSRSAAEFLQYVRANKGKLSYGSTAIGHYAHLGLMEVSDTLDAGMVLVPYKGEAPMLQDLVGGQLQCAFMSPTTIKPMVDAGKLRMLGISGMKRVKALPNVPTLLEEGWTAPIFRMNPGWIGIAGPSGMPPAIVQKLSAEYGAAVRVAEIRDSIVANGMEPVGNTSDEFTATYQAELPIWRELLKKAGLQVRA